MASFSLAWLRSTFRRFAGDRHGAVLVLAAEFIVVAMAAGALAVDVGSIYLAKRQAQAGADLAALAALSAPSDPHAAVTATVRDNGIASDAAVGLEWGIYDPTRAMADRFTPAGYGPATNAARVTIKTSTPLFLGRVISPNGKVDIGAQGTAALTNNAAITIGSRLLGLNGGVLNGLLSALTGSHISLSVMDYQSLASANVDLLGTLKALNTNLNLNAVSYDDVLGANVSAGDLAHAVASSASLGGGVSSALSLLGSEAATTHLRLSDTIDLGSLGNASIASGSTLLNVGVLDLLRESLTASDGQHQLALDLGATIPGLASVTATMTVGERPQWLSYGEKGVSVHTAQTRLLLDAHLLGGQGGLLGASIDLPIYIEIAEANATIASINCSPANPSAATVGVDASTAVTEAWIGNVDLSQMANFSTRPTLTPANFVLVSILGNLAKVSLTGSAHAVVGSQNAQNLTFSASDVTPGTVQTIHATGLIGSLLGSLVGDLHLTAKITLLGADPLGLINAAVQPLIAPLAQLLATTLSTVAAPVDGLVDSLLSTLGIGLGEADIRLVGVSCGVPRLAM